jgi:hypothetical protein
MWKVVVAIFIGGLVLAVVLMSEPVQDKVDLATTAAKKTAKKIQAAVTNSSSVSKSKADLDKEGIRIEGTSASAAIVDNERADAMNAMADEIEKADAAKQAALLEKAKNLLAEQDAAAAKPKAPAAATASTTAAPLTLDQQRAAMEAELKAYDLGKSATAAKTELFEQGVMPFVGFEHAGYT